MTDLAWLSIADAAKRLQARELSPVEYTNALLERIDRYDGSLHSFLHLAADRALDDARAAEAEIVAGNWRGPMHGGEPAFMVGVEGAPDVLGDVRRLNQLEAGAAQRGQQIVDLLGQT